MTSILRQLSDTIMQVKAELSIFVPLIVGFIKFRELKGYKAQIDKIIKGVSDQFLDNNKEKIYEGLGFPKADEVEQLKSLFEIVRDNCIFVDPLDKMN